MLISIINSKTLNLPFMHNIYKTYEMLQVFLSYTTLQDEQKCWLPVSSNHYATDPKSWRYPDFIHGSAFHSNPFIRMKMSVS